jgi:putative pyruvate formate lyase activating enzyme
MGSTSSTAPEEFLLDDFEPAYLGLWRAGLLADRVDTALAELEACRVCPRDCEINRLADETSICHTGRFARVASAFAHFGEEDSLRGSRGSGTIFFGFCTLRCVFCQNWDISQAPAGSELTGEQIAALMIELQAAGCHNINFVTPEHVAPQVVEAIAAAIPLGLNIPIVYNTSAYDSLASLRLLDGLVDIYMPDFKFWTTETARRLARAQDYPHVARAAIAEMHRQVGVLKTGPEGVARRGVLIRHLVMPGYVNEAAEIFRWIAEELSQDTFINIMGQYRPQHQVVENERYLHIDRRPTTTEMTAAYEAARASGLWRFDRG